ncbi:OmpW family outer membrane protein [Variovorax sp. EBFNA2]|uniref:OmpW/AlkL family protein n=1 Tax=Variovorax sp. EBFNA2 TaxID=3342097 RepID=UPI0029BFB6CB|nr:OmpW family outer membrane protein [Variovorax boronicumulans]WPG39394.1 OmpW family outer membrane protein [Variovorax boronicumulans]
MQKKLAPVCIAALLAATTALPAAAQETQGNWLVRARAVYLKPANHSAPVADLSIPADAITINSKTIPELDVTYFFTPNIAAELVLTVPQKQTVTVQQSALGGPVDIGTFKHLPPSLMLQYHFMPTAKIRPYIGAGLNYTRLSSVNLQVPTVGSLQLQNESFGFAMGAGVDIEVAKNTYLNLDVKKLRIRSAVNMNGVQLSTVKVDPWLFGVGVGYRF